MKKKNEVNVLMVQANAALQAGIGANGGLLTGLQFGRLFDGDAGAAWLSARQTTR